MNQETKFLIAIPTINRADLLNEALEKYFEDFQDTEIVICDNGNQEILTRENKMVVYRPEKNLGVSGSWNMLMDYAEKVNATHVLMLNDDIYLGKKELDIKALINLWKPDFFCTELNWCAFVLSLECYKKTGPFDENFFPAYFEDNDYFYRMVLNGSNVSFNAILNPLVYRNSMTIAKEPHLNNGFEKNRQYYITKWGGEPGKEMYSTPFNML
jgi:GT2 family glycosyltransferase